MSVMVDILHLIYVNYLKDLQHLVAVNGKHTNPRMSRSIGSKPALGALFPITITPATITCLISKGHTYSSAAMIGVRELPGGR